MLALINKISFEFEVNGNDKKLKHIFSPVFISTTDLDDWMTIVKTLPGQSSNPLFFCFLLAFLSFFLSFCSINNSCSTQINWIVASEPIPKKYFICNFIFKKSMFGCDILENDRRKLVKGCILHVELTRRHVKQLTAINWSLW